VKDAVWRAREKGVIFDIGHGMGSFASHDRAGHLAGGFKPDVISSDIHSLCIDGPAYDQVTTLSKFLCLGMPLAEVIAASTVNAARALQRPELGSLEPGKVGDATLLQVKEGSFDYEDVVGEVLTGEQRIVATGAVIGGRVWHQAT
jgi:dihydroorotase